MLMILATLGLFKIKVFWYQDHGVIISVHDLTKKILSHDTSYIADVIMWPKFGNSSIFIIEVIILLQGSDQNIGSLWGLDLVEVQ